MVDLRLLPVFACLLMEFDCFDVVPFVFVIVYLGLVLVVCFLGLIECWPGAIGPEVVSFVAVVRMEPTPIVNCWQTYTIDSCLFLRTLLLVLL